MNVFYYSENDMYCQCINVVFYNFKKLINIAIIKSFMALAYITCKDKKEAEKIAIYLLKKRLIACANILPIKSLYWWKGKIVNDRENVIIAKTNAKNFKKVVDEVKNIHSYEIPCILKIDAIANKEYQDWADKELR